MNKQENPNHDDLFEKAAHALREAQVPDGPSDELVARVVASAVAADHQPSSNILTAPLTLGSRIKNMKTIKKIAIAASLLVAASALFAWLALGSQSLAFADVAKAFADVRTAKCTMVVTIEGMPGSEGKALFMAPARERTEEEIEAKGGKMYKVIQIWDWEKKRFITLTPSQNSATVTEIKNGHSFTTFASLLEQFHRAQQGEENMEALGERDIDGKTAVGFRSDNGTLETKIWADPKTELPMLVELQITTSIGYKIVLKDFEYDVELDKSLFDLTPPKGYTVHKRTIDLSPIKGLVEGLRFCAENNEGMFPKKLLGKEGILEVMGKSVYRNAAKWGGDATRIDKVTKENMTKHMHVQKAMIILPSKDNWHYAGAGVKLGDAEKAIFWLKPKGSETYQVLYGDLRVVEDVDEKDLPRVP